MGEEQGLERRWTIERHMEGLCRTDLIGPTVNWDPEEGNPPVEVVPLAALEKEQDKRERAEETIAEIRGQVDCREYERWEAVGRVEKAESELHQAREVGAGLREALEAEEEAAIEFREARNRFRVALEEIREKATVPPRGPVAWTRVQWAADIASVALAHDTYRIPVSDCTCPDCRAARAALHPDPEPPEEKCERCKGRGKTVAGANAWLKCAFCGGTGQKPTEGECDEKSCPGCPHCSFSHEPAPLPAEQVEEAIRWCEKEARLSRQYESRHPKHSPVRAEWRSRAETFNACASFLRNLRKKAE
jgi:hypothetical protein